MNNDLEKMLEDVSGLLNIVESELAKRIYEDKSCLTDQELYQIIRICSAGTFEAYGKAQNSTKNALQ